MWIDIKQLSFLYDKFLCNHLTRKCLTSSKWIDFCWKGIIKWRKWHLRCCFTRRDIAHGSLGSYRFNAKVWTWFKIKVNQIAQCKMLILWTAEQNTILKAGPYPISKQLKNYIYFRLEAHDAINLVYWKRFAKSCQTF